MSGNATLILGNSGCNALFLPNGGTTLTIGMGVVIRGQSGQVGYAPSCWNGPANVTLVNQGTISSDVSGGTVSVLVSSLQNFGTI